MTTLHPIIAAITEHAREQGWSGRETARRLRVSGASWSRVVHGRGFLRYSTIADAFPSIAERYRHTVPSCVTCGEPMELIVARNDAPRHRECPPPLAEPVKITCSQCGVRITVSRRDRDRRGARATCGSARCQWARAATRTAEDRRGARWDGGPSLVAWRMARGWSQTDLASTLGVTQQWVSRWERNAYVPNEKRLTQLAALGFRLDAVESMAS